MDYKYINKVLEKIWKMYHIQNGVIGQNYQIELLIYELSAKSKGDMSWWNIIVQIKGSINTTNSYIPERIT